VPRYGRAGVVHGSWGRLCLEVNSRARKKEREFGIRGQGRNAHEQHVLDFSTRTRVSQYFFSQHVESRMHKC
jgi:hypothetical protein